METQEKQMRLKKGKLISNINKYITNTNNNNNKINNNNSTCMLCYLKKIKRRKHKLMKPINSN